MLVMSGCLWFNKKKQKKFWGNWYVVLLKIIPRNFTELYVTEFGGILPEF
jgi:hypothetical protein